MLLRYLGVRIPDVAVVPGHSTPWRAFCEAYFATAPVSVWLGARALAGKTFTMAVLGWIEAVTLQAPVSILGGSKDQSDNVHQYMRQFWNRPTAPREALSSEPGKSVTRLVWGNEIKALAASQRQARGGHPPRLRLDEADELDWKVFEAIMGQPMDQKGVAAQTVISSTMQNAEGTMSKVLAMARERGWPVHTWGYQETLAPHGWLSEAQVRRKRSEMTAESWRVEVELGEPSLENLAIDRDAVTAMFVGDEVADQPWQYHEFEEPVPGVAYATGCDWAKEHDETVIWTWRPDVTPMRLVAYEHGNKRPWPFMNERLMVRMRRYPGDGYHDVLGVGSSEKDRFTEVVEDYKMVGLARNDLFLDYIAAIERGECSAPKVASAWHAHRACRNDDLFGSGHPPDPLVAAALAYQAALLARNPLGLVRSRAAGQPAQARSGQVPSPSAVTQATSLLGRK